MKEKNDPVYLLIAPFPTYICVLYVYMHVESFILFTNFVGGILR